MSPELMVGFDYTALPAGLTGDLKRAATRVRELIGEQKKSIVETGKVFLAARAKLDHGKFLSWAEAECAVTARTVQRYMQVADMMTGKYDIVSYLEPTALYLLAAPSTPGEVRREIFDRAAKGEKIRPAQIKTSIRVAQNRAPVTHTPDQSVPVPVPVPVLREAWEDGADEIKALPPDQFEKFKAWFLSSPPSVPELEQEPPLSDEAKITKALEAHRAAIKRLNPAQKARFWRELSYIKRPRRRARAAPLA